MASTYSTVKTDSDFAVSVAGKALQTPDKKPLRVPTNALAEAIATEWQANAKYNPAKMPLTSLAYTAIDRIGSQKEAIVEVLMVYIDTDTLSYRASSEKLAKQQEDQWDPVLEWASSFLGAAWESTTGVMPLTQSQELHKTIEKYLLSLSPMHLAAACILSSGFSSLVLAFAVLENHLSAEDAFLLSRLEEEFQAETWGRDAETDARMEKMADEILGAARFLDLLAK